MSMAGVPERNTAVADLFKRGEALLVDARRTIDPLDAALNTAVNVIAPASLERDATNEESDRELDPA